MVSEGTQALRGSWETDNAVRSNGRKRRLRLNIDSVLTCEGLAGRGGMGGEPQVGPSGPSTSTLGLQSLGSSAVTRTMTHEAEAKGKAVVPGVSDLER